MLLARALYPAMLERGSGHLVFVASLSGKSATPPLLRSTTRPSSACAASRSACAPTSPRAGSASPSSRPASIREAGMFADAGADAHRRGWAPPPRSRSATPSLKAIEQDKVEVTVAPLPQRVAAHFALVSPSIAVKVAERRAPARRRRPKHRRRARKDKR